MEDIEHYMQDSCELLAVAKLQEMAEQAGLSINNDSVKKFAAYDKYRLDPRRRVDEASMSDRHAEMFRTYKSNLDTHLPDFFRRLTGLGLDPLPWTPQVCWLGCSTQLIRSPSGLW